MWKIYLAMLISLGAAAPSSKREIGDLRSSLLLPSNLGQPPVGSNLYSEFYNYPLGGYGGAYAPYYPTWYDWQLDGYQDLYDDFGWDSTSYGWSDSYRARLPGYY